MRSARRAVTLVEMLLAMMLFGILAAVIFVAVRPRQSLLQSLDAKRLHHARELMNAMQQYQLDERKLPDPTIPSTKARRQPICAFGTAAADANAVHCINLQSLTPKYIAPVETDPAERCPHLSGYAVYLDHDEPQVLPSLLGRMPGDSIEESCSGTATDTIENGTYTCTTGAPFVVPEGITLTIMPSGVLDLRNCDLQVLGTIVNQGLIKAYGDQHCLVPANASPYHFGDWMLYGSQGSPNGTCLSSNGGAKIVRNLQLAFTGKFFTPATPLPITGTLTVGSDSGLDTTVSSVDVTGPVSNAGFIAFGDNALDSTFRQGMDETKGMVLIEGSVIPNAGNSAISGYHDLRVQNGTETATLNGAIVVTGNMRVDGHIAGQGSITLSGVGQTMTLADPAFLRGVGATHMLSLNGQSAAGWSLSVPAAPTSGTDPFATSMQFLNFHNAKATRLVHCTDHCHDASGNVNIDFGSSVCDCPAPSWCGPDNECHSTCLSDGDCPSPRHCAISTGQCVDCTDDSQCPAGQVCDQLTHTCSDSCACPNGGVWHQDTQTCTQDTFTCSDQNLPFCGCDGSTYLNSCVAANAGVRQGQLCPTNCTAVDAVDPFCTDPALPYCHNGSCVPCVGNDVPSPVCASPTPVCHANACVQCVTDDQCPSGQECNVSTHTCHPKCTAVDAPDPLCTDSTLPYCHNDRCVACVSDAQCDDGNECTTDACVGNACTNVATSDTCGGGSGICDGSGTCGQCPGGLPRTYTAYAVTQTIAVAGGPWAAMMNGTDLYVADYAAHKVSVIDTTNLSTSSVPISVGVNPSAFASARGKVYVSNANPGTVSVINPVSRTVTKTVTVGSHPGALAVAGNYVFVANDAAVNETSLADTVSVIDATNDTVVKTVTVGRGPVALLALNGKVYAANYFSNSVSIIDAADLDAVPAQVAVGTWPKYLASANDNVYVVNSASNSVSVIGSSSASVLSTINFTGWIPTGIVAVGTKLYESVGGVSTSHPGFVTVIDTSGAGHVVKQVTTGYYPVSLAVLGTDVYVANEGDGTASVIHSVDDTVSAPVTVGTDPRTVVTAVGKAFVVNYASNSVSVIDHTASCASCATRSDCNDHNSCTDDACENGTCSHVVNTAHTCTQASGGQGKCLADGSCLDLCGGTCPSDQYCHSGDKVKALATVQLTTAQVEMGNGAMAVLGTNVYVTNQDSNTVSVIDTTSVSLAGTYPSYLPKVPPIAVGSTPVALAVLGDNVYVANYNDASVSVIDSTHLTHSPTTISVGANPIALAASPSNSKVFVADYYDHAVHAIDTSTNHATRIDVGNGPRAMAVLADKLYVVNSADGTVSVINTTTNAVVATVQVGSTPWDITVMGTTLYVANFGDSTVSVLDPSNLDLPAPAIFVGSGPIALAADDANIYVANSASNTVSVIDVSEGTVIATMDVGQAPWELALHNKKVYVANRGYYSDGNTVSIFYATNFEAKPVTVAIPGSSNPEALAVLGSKVFVAGANTTYGATDNFVTAIDDGPPICVIGDPCTLGGDTICGKGYYCDVRGWDPSFWSCKPGCSTPWACDYPGSPGAFCNQWSHTCENSSSS